MNKPPKMSIIIGTTLRILFRRAVLIRFPKRTVANMNGNVPKPKMAIKLALCQIPPAAKLAVRAI